MKYVFGKNSTSLDCLGLNGYVIPTTNFDST